MRTLYGKLAAALLALLAGTSAVYLFGVLVTARLYFQEVSQKLNRDLAAHLVAEGVLEGGRINQAALEETFHWLMVVNPSIELYLLDPQGTILAYSAPAGKVRRSQVALEPVHRFLAGIEAFPILGDDPRDPEGHKVFSAAAVRTGGRVDGYLYVVLGGEEYDSAAQMVQGSYILRLGLGAVAVSLACALAVGLLLFFLITRRLRRLAASMDALARTDFRAEAAALPTAGASGRDEIARLGSTFERMARRIAEQVERLRREDRLRRELVANVSHDLRTPLATLQGYLETLLLKEGKLSPEESRRYLEIALRHSERLGTLVAELFELAKLDAQETKLQLEPFALGELVQDVMQKFQLAAERRRVRLEAELLEELPRVWGDIALIERVLENLIDNALRHTPPGGRVAIVPSSDGRFVTVRVADTGCGIPQEDLPYVFERFYRARNGLRRSVGHDRLDGIPESREPNGGGSGLGLAIAKRILELHGTSIAAESAPGAGSTFTFQLPTHSPFGGP